MGRVSEGLGAAPMTVTRGMSRGDRRRLRRRALDGAAAVVPDARVAGPRRCGLDCSPAGSTGRQNYGRADKGNSDRTHDDSNQEVLSEKYDTCGGRSADD